MKLHHAAALALVGWYLMIPPHDPTVKGAGSYLAARPAPLSQWVMFDSYDTAEECKTVVAYGLKRKCRGEKLHPTLKYDGGRVVPENVPKVKAMEEEQVNCQMLYAGVWGKCIASDDPRLVK